MKTVLHFILWGIAYDQKLVFQSSIKYATIYFIVVLSMLFAVLSDIAPPRMPISIHSLLSVGHQNVMRDKGRSG